MLDVDTRVRYGILGKPAPPELIWKGEGPPPAAGHRANTPTKIRDKMRRFQTRLRQLAAKGVDTRPHRQRFGAFQKLLRSGRPGRAEKALDDAIKALPVSP